MYNTLKIFDHQNIRTIEIHRPEKLNALSLEVFHELKIEFDKIQNQDQLIRGVMLTGSGEKAFIAGADISQMNQMTPEEGYEYSKLAQGITEEVEMLRVPVIACVQGYALGGGCEMALASDFIYATENAQFGQPEVNLGLIPGFGGCIRLSKFIPLPRAKEMIFTGKLISGKEARDYGLVNELFSTKSEMMSAAKNTLLLIQKKSPFAISIAKEVMREASGKSTHEGLKIEREYFKTVFQHPEKKIGVEAFLKKEKPNFTPSLPE